MYLPLATKLLLREKESALKDMENMDRLIEQNRDEYLDEEDLTELFTRRWRYMPDDVRLKNGGTLEAYLAANVWSKEVCVLDVYGYMSTAFSRQTLKYKCLTRDPRVLKEAIIAYIALLDSEIAMLA